MKRKIQHLRGTENSPEMLVCGAQRLPLSLILVPLDPLNISRGFSALISCEKFFEKVLPSSRKGKSMSYLPPTPPQSFSFEPEHILSNYSPPGVSKEKGRTDSTAQRPKTNMNKEKKAK